MTFIGTKIHVKKINKNSSKKTTVNKISSQKLKFRLQVAQKSSFKNTKFWSKNSGYNITKSSFKHKIPVTSGSKKFFQKHKVLVQKFWLQYHKKFFQTQNSGYKWLKKVLSKTQSSGPKILVTISQKVLSTHKIPVTIPVTSGSQKFYQNKKFQKFQTQNSGYNITKSSFKHKIPVTISQKVLSNTKFWLQYTKSSFKHKIPVTISQKSYLQN